MTRVTSYNYNTSLNEFKEKQNKRSVLQHPTLFVAKSVLARLGDGNSRVPG